MSYHHRFPDPPPSQQPWSAAPQYGGTAPQAWDQSWGTPQAWDETWDTAPQAEPEPDRHYGDPYSSRDDMHQLRRGYQKLRRVSTFTALGYFVAFLFLSGYAPGTMTGEVSGGLTTGVLLGLLTLPVTLAAIAAYERIARHRVDPLAATIRERAEYAAQAAAPRQERPSRTAQSGWQYGAGGAHA
ncbi:DUF485 domain-containing protein [Streptomyces sp. NPDC002187]|uniref:DUF485 domain-containing protein n=1 Tax=Streptomyces sp. NPDC002187 TaxID=3364637 RepID=UPI0036BCF693